MHLFQNLAKGQNIITLVKCTINCRIHAQRNQHVFITLNMQWWEQFPWFWGSQFQSPHKHVHVFDQIVSVKHFSVSSVHRNRMEGFRYHERSYIRPPNTQPWVVSTSTESLLKVSSTVLSSPRFKGRWGWIELFWFDIDYDKLECLWSTRHWL